MIRNALIVLLLTAAVVSGGVRHETKRMTANPGTLVQLPVDTPGGKVVLWQPLQPLTLDVVIVESKEDQSILIFHADPKKLSEVVITSQRWDAVGDVLSIRWIITLGDDANPDDGGDDDEDEDEVTPDVPSDAFDNVGQRVAGWAKGLDGTEKAAKCYRDAVKTLREEKLTINSVNAKLLLDLADAVAYEEYRTVWDNINKDANTRWAGITRFKLADYYDAIAAGLDGAK